MRYDKWDIAGFDRDKAVELCNNNINPLAAVLLASRNITGPAEAAAFLDADTEPFHDPFLMADMDKAVARINKALKNKEHVAIYGDYDVDGMTSAATLALWLGSKGVSYEIYIPGRLNEGYSLNAAALDTLKEHGVSLVITVDCGIIACDEARHAKDIGLDLVITDHHEFKEPLPEAAAVIDPRRPDCKYPFKPLAGVGVVYKLICALEGDYLSDDVFSRFGSLVALGTVADVMPVLGENRKLIKRGLEIINSSPVPGLRSLIGEVCPDSGNVTASTISYLLAPRLNAAGRMGDSMLSVKLLLSSDAAEAQQYVAQLCRLNDDRRESEQQVLSEAMAQLGKNKPAGPIVLSSDKWHQGVTGIVASKLEDRFNLPVVIISVNEDGFGHGSCRSSDSFSIYDALCGCSDLFVDLGGHKWAAGFTIAKENIGKLRRHLGDYYISHTAGSSGGAGLKVDFEVEKPSQLLTLDNIEALKCLEPFGNGNPVPCLCITGAVITDVISIGSGKHVKLKVTKSGRPFDCIFFSVTPGDLGVAAGDIADIAFEPQINEYRDRRSVQLQLVDIRKSSITAGSSVSGVSYGAAHGMTKETNENKR